MGMLRVVMIAFLATFAAAVASADGPAPHRGDRYRHYEPAPAPGFFDFNWSGFYAGAHLGAGFASFEANETFIDPLDPLLVPQTLTYDQSVTSVVGGVQVGWQKQWEKLVAGVELTYTVLPFDETTISPLVTTTTLARTAELHDLITLTGRLGYADGRWHAYAKGGVASAEVDVSYEDILTGARSSSGGRETGWTAGVGIDYALTYNLFLGVEYNYLHFNTDPPQPPAAGAIGTGGAEFDIQTLVVRLNYRFGGPAH
jgi:opacity protein-like surface antigen